MIKKINMIILRQADIAAAIAFYQNLGLRLKFHLKESWAEMSLDTIRIGLCPSSIADQNNTTGIVLEVEDAYAFYQTYKDTVQFVLEPKEAVHGIMCSIKDSGGNILEIYQPTPEKVAELARLTAQKDGKSAIKAMCCQKNQNGTPASLEDKCCKTRRCEADLEPFRE